MTLQFDLNRLENFKLKSVIIDNNHENHAEIPYKSQNHHYGTQAGRYRGLTVKQAPGETGALY